MSEEDDEFEEAAEAFAEMKREEEKPIQDDIDEHVILKRLGFKMYDNKENGIAFKLNTRDLKIARVYNEKNPEGIFWAQCKKDCEYGKKGEFVDKERLLEIPIISIFYRIRDKELPIPPETVEGKIIGKTERAIKIEFTEFGELKTNWWGNGAIKKNEQGISYIPAGFSKETEKNTAKMTVPRDIIIQDFEQQIAQAPIVQPQSQEKPQSFQLSSVLQQEDQGIEEKRDMIAEDMMWATDLACEAYKRVKEEIGPAQIKDAGEFIEKTAVTLLLTIQKLRGLR
ncbi:hypothetical protein DRN97_02170 [Methanosarcinales archaeon]|nr:MAG: hypothetical protein DRN97_02170 [Methanosarcinales archaeon]